MPTYGVTSTGFLRKPVRAILEGIEASQHSEISATLDLSSATPWGQNNGIFANELGVAWEILEVCYHAFDPDAAPDFLLTSLSKLTGTERRAASHSLVTLECELDDGTELIAGTHFAAVAGDSTSLWTPNEDFTAVGDDTFEVVFRAENSGPVPAQHETINVIHTAIQGWHSVDNPEAAELGKDIDTDDELRARREGQLAAVGGNTTDAIRSDVLEIDEVDSCKVFENDTDATVDGMAPHSIEVLVFDGEIPAADDDAIAQAIWNNKPAGIQTMGDEEGTAIDVEGASHTVHFSRPTVEEIYIDITVESGAGYEEAGGDAALAEFLAVKLKDLHGVGDDVKWRRVDSLAFQFGQAAVSVTDVTSFTLGLAPSPVGIVNVPIAPRAIASFDASRITVTS